MSWFRHDSHCSWPFYNSNVPLLGTCTCFMAFNAKSLSLFLLPNFCNNFSLAPLRRHPFLPFVLISTRFRVDEMVKGCFAHTKEDFAMFALELKYGFKRRCLHTANSSPARKIYRLTFDSRMKYFATKETCD